MRDRAHSSSQPIPNNPVPTEAEIYMLTSSGSVVTKGLQLAAVVMLQCAFEAPAPALFFSRNNVVVSLLDSTFSLRTHYEFERTRPSSSIGSLASLHLSFGAQSRQQKNKTSAASPTVYLLRTRYTLFDAIAAKRLAGRLSSRLHSSSSTNYDGKRDRIVPHSTVRSKSKPLYNGFC